ncbi:T9SS type A sorting domain-containing protein, partial [bacterium]|nr:T9SS type A sorting domain-containing protein [bacterium]
TIKYSISSDALAHIAIYDITGKFITTLVNQVQPAGWHEIQWNGTYQNGKDVPGGIYLSRVTVGNEVKTNKLILLK